MATTSDHGSYDFDEMYIRLTSKASRAAADALFQATGNTLTGGLKQEKALMACETQSDLEEVLHQIQVERRLDVSEDELCSMARSCKVISYKLRGSRVYPAWQFRGNVMLSGLPEVLSELQCSGVEALRMFTIPLELADGKSLYQLLIEGKVSKSVQIARSLRDGMTPHDEGL